LKRDIITITTREKKTSTMPSQAALLIGNITHARKDWESLSSILVLKVRNSLQMQAAQFHRMTFH
jgi:hypothetical protein